MRWLGPVVASRDSEINYELLSHVRDFKGWMSPLGIKLHNCWVSRGGKTAPHSFTFQLRMDFPPCSQNNLQHPPHGLLPNDLDVFCITKPFMASKQPCGQPALVMPSSLLERMAHHPTGTCYARNPMSDARRKHLRDLASALEAFTHEWSSEHSYFRAAAELRLLADGRDAVQSEDGYLDTDAPPRVGPIELTALSLALCSCQLPQQ